MRKTLILLLLVLCAISLAAGAEGEEANLTPWTESTRIDEVTSWPGFGDWGRLIFPVDEWYYSGETLGQLRLTWYNNIQPAKTVEIVNWMREKTLAGEQIFYPIYTEEEMSADPTKRDAGLFFFKGNPGARFAIVNAGGGMAYVGAMHDSFPHALELSRLGYNGFALIYRPGYDTAPADLARAIAYIHEHAEELEVDVTDYSLWGGSAGARMAAWLGSYRTSDFGEKEYPRPAAVIMQYTGLSEVYGNEPPTYNCVGTSDGIASYRTMEWRIAAIKANGTDTMIEVFSGLPHGFGLGTGTVAEGWLNNAVAFWERQMNPAETDADDQKTAIRMTFGDGTVGFMTDIRDHATARAFLDMLPMTVRFSDWDGREYWYSDMLPYDEDSVQHTYAIGEFTYWCGGWVTAYYNTNEDTVIEAGSVVIGMMDDTAVQQFANANGAPQEITFEIVPLSETQK